MITRKAGSRRPSRQRQTPRWVLWIGLVAFAAVAAAALAALSRSWGDQTGLRPVAAATPPDAPASAAPAARVSSSAPTGASKAPPSTAPPRTVATPLAVKAPAPTTTVASLPRASVARAVVPPAKPAPPPPPPTLPDGSLAPVLAVFDTDTVMVRGSVRSQAAVDRLRALGTANSKTGATVVSELTINPRVSDGVGVRVIELHSARFAPGSTAVTPEHAAEFQRIITVMKGLPQVTALVIGHADQRGPAAANLVLSAERATAVVDYLVSQGISPDRLSSRGVGASDLLTGDMSDAALALNRRTEFVFYGLVKGT
jgi:outer membrane protein OmpA-like peptidoglycan-associated protein